MKSSSGEPEPLDLDSGLPVTPEDVAALRRAREQAQTMSGDEYLAFLASFGHATYEELKARPLFKGEPFVLHGRDDKD